MSTIERINSLTAISPLELQKYIDVCEHDIQVKHVRTNLRLHNIRFDGNGMPMINALAELLYQHIINYCLAVKSRTGELTPQQSAIYIKKARKLFRKPEIDENNPDTTGEAGEALLYIFMEAILEAPQIVAKMELKTNPRDELKGSDGIHMKWCPEDRLVDLYFGEAKLYKSVSSAIGSAINSINEFHDKEMYKHEYSLVTNNFKHASEEIKIEVIKLFESGGPGADVRVNHACLIGYDWDEYKKIPSSSPKEMNDKFKKQLINDAPRLVEMLESRFESFNKKHLRFDVFFLPFPSVSDFRNAFNAALD